MSPPAPVDAACQQGTSTSSAPVYGPLTVDGVSAWRSKAASMPKGVAPYTSSDFFKTPVRRISS